MNQMPVLGRSFSIIVYQVSYSSRLRNSIASSLRRPHDRRTPGPGRSVHSVTLPLESALARVNVLKSKELFRALSGERREVELDDLTVLFESADAQSIPECRIGDLSPLGGDKAVAEERDSVLASDPTRFEALLAHHLWSTRVQREVFVLLVHSVVVEEGDPRERVLFGPRRQFHHFFQKGAPHQATPSDRRR